MVYVTQTRRSSKALDKFTNTSGFISGAIPPSVAFCGTIWNGVASVPQYYRDLPYGDVKGVVGQQETYSWRTGKVLREMGLLDRDLTGEEMRDALLQGYDVNVEPSVVGADRVEDVKGSPFVGNSDFSSHDTGHNFRTRKVVNTSSINRWVGPRLKFTAYGTNPNLQLRYAGPVLAVQNLPAFTFTPPSTSERMHDGALLVNSSVPTRPYASVARSIGELIKDGLPSIFGAGLLRAGLKGIHRGSASEYLNVQFGVVPLLSDLRKILQAVVKSSEIIDKYAASSGEWTERKRGFEVPVVSTTISQSLSRSDVLLYLGTSPSGPYTDWRTSFLAGTAFQGNVLTQTTRLRRFSGAFTYALPEGDELSAVFGRYASKAQKLLGLKLDASVMYDVTPFSWLVDWAVDFGTVFSNAVAFNTDNLVMQYGYVMHHDVMTVSRTITGLKDLQGRILPPFVSDEYTHEWKSRDRANPYGFGVDVGSLTSYQWSILAALGLSRGRNINHNEPL